MPNPTRQEIIRAHEELEKLCERLPATRAAKESILKALPPKPQPTMAEVEWDDDKHYLAEAEHGTYSGVVMLSKNALSGTVRVLAKIGDINDVRTVEAVELTPTGKRYTLTEVQDG